MILLFAESGYFEFAILPKPIEFDEMVQIFRRVQFAEIENVVDN